MKTVILVLAVTLFRAWATTVAAQQSPHPNAPDAIANPDFKRIESAKSDADRKIEDWVASHGWKEGRLKSGDTAPDFNLKKVSSEERVRLSSLTGKVPVALIFGSYTCPQIRDQSGAINEMAKMYRDKVKFLFIYIREAHTPEAWQLERNKKDNILLYTAKNIDEKEAHAVTCVSKLGINFSTLVDDMDNSAEQGYSAWPNRLYLIGKDGRIIWKGGLGPRGFHAEELDVAIIEELARQHF